MAFTSLIEAHTAYAANCGYWTASGIDTTKALVCLEAINYMLALRATQMGSSGSQVNYDWNALAEERKSILKATGVEAAAVSGGRPSRFCKMRGKSI